MSSPVVAHSAEPDPLRCATLASNLTPGIMNIDDNPDGEIPRAFLGKIGGDLPLPPPGHESASSRTPTAGKLTTHAALRRVLAPPPSRRGTTTGAQSWCLHPGR